MPGVEVSFAARDAGGSRWLFDVSGGFTSTRPGLRRAETLWKSLAKAAIVRQAQPPNPFVLLTTAVPLLESAAEAALSALLGPDRPIRDVIVLSNPRDLERLQAHAAAVETSAAP
jgi:hypothetical protein